MGTGRMSKHIIGLTGGIGSGKSTVCEVFTDFGVDVIDADQVARDVVAPNTPALTAIADRFGSEILINDDAGLPSLNRAALREKVFTSSQHKEWLNQLLHPLIRQEMLQQCQQASSHYCLLVVPLLLENKLQSLVKQVVVVDLDETVQFDRACARDDSKPEIIKNIMKSQFSRQQRLRYADYIIDNSQTISELKAQVTSLHHIFEIMD